MVSVRIVSNILSCMNEAQIPAAVRSDKMQKCEEKQIPKILICSRPSSRNLERKCDTGILPLLHTEINRMNFKYLKEQSNILKTTGTVVH